MATSKTGQTKAAGGKSVFDIISKTVFNDPVGLRMSSEPLDYFFNNKNFNTKPDIGLVRGGKVKKLIKLNLT